jgi:ketosteroid isomerase-like protein
VKSKKITADVRAFFTTYATAYARQDVPAIVKHFAETIHISGDTGDRVTVHVETREQMGKTIAHLLEMYRAIDFGVAEALALATDEMSARLVQARVLWLLRDKSGNPLYEFDAMYTLARHTDLFRITALAHNEIPNYRHFLTARSGKTS